MILVTVHTFLLTMLPVIFYCFYILNILLTPKADAHTISKICF